MSDGWTRKPLGDVVTLQRGFDLPKRLRCNGDVPVVSSSGPEDWHNEPIKVGPGLVTGRYGTIGKVFFIDGPYWPLNTTLFVSNFHSNDPRFCYYLLQRFDFAGQSGKTGVPGVNRNDLHAIDVWTPDTLEEQQAIAAALSDADGVVAGLERVIAKKRLIKQGAMQDLLTARRRLPGFSGEWGIATLRQLCSQIQDGTHFTPTYVDHGIPFYSVENVTARNFDKCKYVTPEAHSAMAKRCRPTRGDILMTRIGSIGDTYLVDWDHEASIYVSLCLLRPSRLIDARYLYAYTRSSMFVKEAEDRSLPNAIPKKINLGDISDIRLRMPLDPEEQATIAAVLSDMDAEIQTLQSRLTKARAVKEGMMQNLLTGRVRLV